MLIWKSNSRFGLITRPVDHFIRYWNNPNIHLTLVEASRTHWCMSKNRMNSLRIQWKYPLLYRMDLRIYWKRKNSLRDPKLNGIGLFRYISQNISHVCPVSWLTDTFLMWSLLVVLDLYYCTTCLVSTFYDSIFLFRSLNILSFTQTDSVPVRTQSCQFHLNVN